MTATPINDVTVRRAGRPRALVALLVLVSAVLALSGLGTPAEAAFPGTNGRIAYEQFGGSSINVRTMKPDGTGVITVAKNAWAPSWRADGKRLAFVREVKGVPQLFVSKPDGTGRRQVTDLTYGADEPAWSPNGARLAFVRYSRSGASSIWRVNAADGSGLKRIVAPTDAKGRTTYPFEPAWAPNGKKIAYSRLAYTSTKPHGDYAVFTINPDGTSARRLTPVAGYFGPDWAPNSARIVYFKAHSGCDFSIHTMKPDGTSKRKIVDTPCFDGEPAWSPNGKRIVFASTGPTFPNNPVEGLYDVNPDGTNLKLAKKGDLYAPDWQPRP